MMQIHHFVKRGTSHKDFCEDFVLLHNLNDFFFVGAVFDGCSSGKDSHFASTLYAKLLRKVANTFREEKSASPADLLERLLYAFVQNLVETREALQLQLDELLSTMILMLYQKVEHQVEIISIGDGLISINGDHHEIDHDNQPDYLAYHMDGLQDQQVFASWFTNHPHRFSAKSPEDLSISSDGIFTYHTEKQNRPKEASEPFDPTSYLLEDRYLIHNPSMLKRKSNILQKKGGLKYVYRPRNNPKLHDRVVLIF